MSPKPAPDPTPGGDRRGAGGRGWSAARTAAYLAARAAAVEEALSGAVPPASAPPETLHAAMRHTLLAPAKRLRPVLLLTAAESTRAASDGPAVAVAARAMPAACAVELVHTYSLIHDDLPCMDDDDLRRGRPTSHRVYGEALALLAGDALLTHAFGLLVSLEVPQAVLARVLGELVEASGTAGMIGGQVEDLAVEGEAVSLATLRSIHRRKTGALLRAAVRMGAMLGEADEEELAALTAYGEAFGLAFQIVDDILDVVGDPHTMGKTAGRDAQRGKATYPGAVGLPRARELAAAAAAQAAAALAPLGDRGEVLRALSRYVVDRQK